MFRLISRVDISTRFEKSFFQLPKRIQQFARKKDKIFREHAFHPSLETHKLGGELKNDWAYSVNREYRVHFYFVDIGTHEIYK